MPDSKRRLFGSCWLLLVLAAGCGPSSGTISGKVTYKGKQLPCGTVTFLGPGERMASGLIATDGTYLIPKVPVGPVTVTVVTHPPIPVGLSPIPMAPPPGSYVAIPARYKSPERSGLNYTVTRGSQTYDIHLQP
jgi:hypothetical protein